jgi:hypothetical protein
MNINEFAPQTTRILTEQNEVKNAYDPITHNPRNTNSDHSAVHYGLGFCAHLYLASLAASATQVYRFKGPTDLFAHLKSLEVAGQGATCAFRIYRGVTLTANGTLVSGAIQNLNDNSPVEPESELYNGTVTYSAATLWCEKIFHGSTDSSGNKNIQSGASFVQNPNLEYVTKDGDTDYVIEIENLDPTYPCVHLGVNMFFYEEEHGYVAYS